MHYSQCVGQVLDEVANECFSCSCVGMRLDICTREVSAFTLSRPPKYQSPAEDCSLSNTVLGLYYSGSRAETNLPAEFGLRAVTLYNYSPFRRSGQNNQ